MKKMLTALIITAAFTTQAQQTATSTAPNTSTVSADSVVAKKSPVSLNWLLDAYTANSNAITGIAAENYLYIGYKIDKNHSVTVTPIIATDASKEQRNQDQIHTQYLQTDLTFKRSNILTEDKHGVSLSASFGNSFYARSATNDSRHHLSLSAAKTFGKLSLSSGLTGYVYARTTGKTTGTQNYTTLSLTPTYSFTDNLSTSAAFLWYNLQSATKYTTGNFQNEKLRFVPSLDMSVGKFGASVYFDTYIVKSHDKRDAFADNWVQDGSIGLNLTYSLL